MLFLSKKTLLTESSGHRIMTRLATRGVFLRAMQRQMNTFGLLFVSGKATIVYTVSNSMLVTMVDNLAIFNYFYLYTR